MTDHGQRSHVNVRCSPDWEPSAVYLDGSFWFWACGCGASAALTDQTCYRVERQAWAAFLAHKTGAPMPPEAESFEGSGPSKYWSGVPAGGGMVFMFLGAGGAIDGPLAVLVTVVLMLAAVVVAVRYS